jgi:hypothetical protein
LPTARHHAGRGVRAWPVGRCAPAVARAAPRRSRNGLPFAVWMALAKASPVVGIDDGAQPLLLRDAV